MSAPSKWRNEWAEAVRQCRDLSPTARLVAQVLALDYANDETGLCCPGRKTLADHIGASEATIKRAIADLTRAGWLGTTRAPGREQTTAYCFLSPGKVVAFAPTDTKSAGHKRPATDAGTRVKSASNAGQKRPAMKSTRVIPDSNGGQICTAPYKGYNHLSNHSARPTASSQDCPVQHVVEITPGSHRQDTWDRWLADHGWPRLAELGERVRLRKGAGWLMPSAMPPDDADGIGQKVADRYLSWAMPLQPKAARA